MVNIDCHHVFGDLSTIDQYGVLHTMGENLKMQLIRTYKFHFRIRCWRRSTLIFNQSLPDSNSISFEKSPNSIHWISMDNDEPLALHFLFNDSKIGKNFKMKICMALT